MLIEMALAAAAAATSGEISDDCGEWKFVENFPDFTVRFVESFGDIEIKYVTSFPGLP